MSHTKAKASDAEKVQKLQFDNQILMGRLTQYKKAEKGAKELVTEYETMKQKYFSVMTENKDLKTQVVELMQTNCDKEIEIKQSRVQFAEKLASFERVAAELKELRKEREKAINERYSLVMEINKKVNLIESKDQEVRDLQDQLERAVGNLHVRQKQSTRTEADEKRYLNLLDQVQKHIKTLVKYLHDQVATTNDPNVIEHTNR